MGGHTCFGLRSSHGVSYTGSGGEKPPLTSVTCVRFLSQLSTHGFVLKVAKHGSEVRSLGRLSSPSGSLHLMAVTEA